LVVVLVLLVAIMLITLMVMTVACSLFRPPRQGSGTS
jgi:hypothetical protein